MTETTDIKALRIEAANLIGLLTSEGHQSFTLDKTADFFDDVFRLLEAERQRADEQKSLYAQERERAGRFLRERDCSRNSFDELQAELKAERQQREAAEAELSDLLNQEFQQRLANAEHQLEMKDLAIRNVKASRMAQFRKRKAAEEELATLRGAQEPVVLSDETVLDWGYRNDIQGDASKLRCMIDDAATLGNYQTSHPAKPVVVLTPPINPVMFNADVMFGYNKARAEDKVAIEAAGIVVKDGE